MAQALEDDIVQRRLNEVPDWKVVDGELRRALTFADFAEAFAFMTRVGLIAQRLNHHPDMAISWSHLTISVSSHAAGGITDQCFELASAIDAALVSR
jgi:4a-hydroxytetrahydrobiopterin dehydratase